MALDEIYKEVILDHYKSPRNKRELPNASYTCSRNNPLCGDEIRVSANVEGDRLTDVTASVLAVAGSEDVATPPELLEEIAAGISGCRLVVLDGVAHLPSMERPGEFNRVVLEFLANLDRSP